MYRVLTVPGHIRIVNDPVELVPLLMTFNDPSFKRVYELLSKSWMSEDELSAQIDSGNVPVCLQILKKGNLVEEQWRMPKRGEKPIK
ncbi:MAG: ArsR family transcriptional regulator, partial [Methanoregulaceae archaeon]|nr:ArsR family transcriptional regulator [Methanoregulaceae archaeon]